MWEHICGAIFFNEERDLTPQSLFHEVGDSEQYGCWRWPVSSCIHHTHTIKYLQQRKLSWLIRTLANNWQNYTGSFLKFYGDEWRWQRIMIWENADTENVHTCAYCVSVYPLSLHVLEVISTVYCVTWMEKIYCGAAAQKIKGQEDKPALYTM